MTTPSLYWVIACSKIHIRWSQCWTARVCFLHAKIKGKHICLIKVRLKFIFNWIKLRSRSDLWQKATLFNFRWVYNIKSKLNSNMCLSSNRLEVTKLPLEIWQLNSGPMALLKETSLFDTGCWLPVSPHLLCLWCYVAINTFIYYPQCKQTLAADKYGRLGLKKPPKPVSCSSLTRVSPPFCCLLQIPVKFFHHENRWVLFKECCFIGWKFEVSFWLLHPALDWDKTPKTCCRCCEGFVKFILVTAN